jgi:hypothetical protein
MTILDGRVRMPSTAFSLKRGEKIRGRKHDPDHLAYIRSLPCLVSGSNFNVEAAHIRYSDARWKKINPGVGRKPDDCWTVPLSAEMHRLGEEAQHNGNERAFWERHGIDPLEIATALYAVTGQYEAGLKIIREARGA